MVFKIQIPAEIDSDENPGQVLGAVPSAWYKDMNSKSEHQLHVHESDQVSIFIFYNFSLIFYMRMDFLHPSVLASDAIAPLGVMNYLLRSGVQPIGSCNLARCSCASA